MKQKKLIQVVIGLILVMLFLAACGTSEPSTRQGSPTSVPSPPANTPAPADTAVPLIDFEAQLVVRNGTIIDGTGPEPIPNGLVAIQDGRITAVGPEAEFAIPDGVQVLDAQGGPSCPDSSTLTSILWISSLFVRAG